MLMETGYYTNISGCGNVLEEFMEKKTLSEYSGEHSQISKLNESGFWTSRLRYLPFDSTFTFLPTDVDQR